MQGMHLHALNKANLASRTTQVRNIEEFATFLWLLRKPRFAVQVLGYQNSRKDMITSDARADTSKTKYMNPNKLNFTRVLNQP